MFSMTSLKCFAVAAEELNFTRAAKRLYITQQALSNHIAKLEQYFGIKLFLSYWIGYISMPMQIVKAFRAARATEHTLAQ